MIDIDIKFSVIMSARWSNSLESLLHQCTDHNTKMRYLSSIPNYPWFFFFKIESKISVNALRWSWDLFCGLKKFRKNCLEKVAEVVVGNNQRACWVYHFVVRGWGGRVVLVTSSWNGRIFLSVWGAIKILPRPRKAQKFWV